MFYGRQLIGDSGRRQTRPSSGILFTSHGDRDHRNPEKISTPTIVATVDSLGVGAGTAMVIYSLLVQPVDGRTQISLDATTIDGNEVDYDYYCNFTIVGKLI